MLSFKSEDEIAKLKQAVDEGMNPRDAKALLGEEIVDRFHGAGSGSKAHEAFRARFSQNQLPENIEEVSLTAPDGLVITQVLKQAGLVSSTSDAIRMIDSGAVRIDGEKIENKALMLACGSQQVIQVGKRRIAKVALNQ